MKRIVSVSLGSSKRNHRAEAEFFGESFIIERIGTDGNYDKLIELIKKLDGKVDVFGMGGIDIYLRGSKKKYVIRDALPIKEAARLTPMVDGSGLKNTLEKRVVRYINDTLFSLKDKRVLMTSAADRFGMAEALHEAGANIVFGDLIFGLDIPLPIKSFGIFKRVADALLPVIVRMPFEKLYPTGRNQDVIEKKHEKYYMDAEIIAGDYLYIKKYMPESLEDKVILTNTVTREDVEDLRIRGANMLITTTPEFNGRSFGTNVVEALLVSILQKDIDSITDEDYENILDRIGFVPRIETFRDNKYELS